MDRKKLPQPEERYFVSDGIKLHYVEWGEPGDETLVLVHGNRDQCRSWDLFVAGLRSQGCRPGHVVALDLRGHGDSDWPSTQRHYQHEDFLYDLAAFVRHLGQKPFSLIGHSLGGSMSVVLAGCFPSSVKKLVLIEAVGPYARSDDDVPKLLARWLSADGIGADGSFYPTLEEAARAIQKRFPTMPDHAAMRMALYGMKSTERGFVWKYDPRMRFPSYSNFSEGQIRAFIERIECPTLLIYGESGDFMDSPRAARVPLFKNSRLVGIPGAGHHVPHERPSELAEVVCPFLSK